MAPARRALLLAVALAALAALAPALLPRGAGGAGAQTSRRALVRRVLAPAAASALLAPAGAPAREWISGRAQGNKEGDVSGTKKDPKYLRCLNNCLPACIGGPSGEQREKRDCLQSCQDECCETYAQCSYAIVKD